MKPRSSCPEAFCKNGVLKNFPRFTEKQLCLVGVRSDCRWPERFSVNENYERHDNYPTRGISFGSPSLDNRFNKTGYFD